MKDLLIRVTYHTTIPPLSDQVDIHYLVFLWTGYVLVVKPFFNCPIAISASIELRFEENYLKGMNTHFATLQSWDTHS